MFSELGSPLGNGLTFASLSTGGYDSDHDEARRSAPDKSNRGSCSNRVAAKLSPRQNRHSMSRPCWGLEVAVTGPTGGATIAVPGVHPPVIDRIPVEYSPEDIVKEIGYPGLVN